MCGKEKKKRKKEVSSRNEIATAHDFTKNDVRQEPALYLQVLLRLDVGSTLLFFLSFLNFQDRS